MKNLYQLLLQALVPRWLIITVLILSFVGFIDATYLSIEHFLGQVPPCNISVFNCASVTQSQYSLIFGIPVALFGSVYYLVMLIVSIFTLSGGISKYLKLFLVFLTPVGFIFSLYFLSIQAFIIKAWCVYCVFSALVSIALFVLCIVWIKMLRKMEYFELFNNTK